LHFEFAEAEDHGDTQSLLAEEKLGKVAISAADREAGR
jgi:hypothetical protein